jgi:phage-related protein
MALPESGVNLVAKGEAAFQRAMSAATAAIQKQGDAAQSAASKSVSGNSALGKSISSLQEKYLSLVPGGQASIDMLSEFSAGLGVSTAATLATVAAVAALAVGLIALGTRGAALTGLADSFDRLTANLGISSQELLINLRKAAAGTVSDFDLIRRANLALAGATGEFGKQFGQNLPKILEIARTQARATGYDVDFLYESLVAGIKRATPRLIDNTGIVIKIGEANEAFAQSLGKTVDQLTEEDKQIAVLNATLEIGQQAIDIMGDAHETAATKIARGQATITNILDRLGLAVQPGFELILDGVNRILGVIEKLAGVIGIFLSPIVEIFGTVFNTVVEVVMSAIEPIVDAVASVAPYLGILFQGIVAAIQLVGDIISQTVGFVVNLLKDAAKNFFGLDLDNLGPALFEGAARAFGAFANGIIAAANQLIFPAVIGIAQFIADFLVGFSPPKKGPLSKIDEGGANVMSSWLQGLVGVSLDPVKKVAAEVSASLGSIGTASLGQVTTRLAQLDRALLPFQNRLTIVKSTFDAIAEPAKLALDAIDRQMNTALEALGRGEAGSEETVRRLDAQRAAIEGSLNAQQRLVDSAQIQLGLATAQQARERALLGIRKAALEAQQKMAQVTKPLKAGAVGKPEVPKEVKGAGGATPVTPTGGGAGLAVPTLQPDETTLDFLTGGIEAAKAGIQDAFAGEIDTSQLSLLQENTGKLQEQLGRIGNVDLGGALHDKFEDLVKNVFDPNTAGSPAALLTDLLDSITNPTRAGSVPYFFQTTLPANIDAATAVVSERVSKLFDSIFNVETTGSPAQVVHDLLDSITNPEREGSIPYFFNTTLPDSIASAQASVSDALRGFFNVFDPNAKDSPAASVKKFVETLFGDSETDGSIAHFFASLPDNINAALTGLPAAISAAFGLDNEDSALSQVKNFFATLAGDSSVEGSIASFFVNLPANIVNAIGDLWAALQPLFTPFEEFFTGVGPGSLADIINQGIQWFAAIPGAIINALQGLGRSAYSAMVLPIIQTVNGLIRVVEDSVRGLMLNIAQFVTDVMFSLGQFAPPFLTSIRDGLLTSAASFSIPKISEELPAFLQPTAAATGGLFEPGLMRVGERGQELMASADKTAVFPNSFVTAVDRLTEAILAQPTALPIGGVSSDSHDVNVVFNGVQGGQDAVRRFARLRAQR